MTLDYDKAEIHMYAESTQEIMMRLHSCKKEPETISWIEDFKPQSMFYDVGANTGAYSLVAASQGHRVVAFEPAAPNYHRLVQHVILNKLPVICFPVVLADESDIVDFSYASLEPGAALHSISDEGIHVPVPAFALDDLMKLIPSLPLPDYVKIDTDGYEFEVIWGARKALKAAKSVLVEMDGEISKHADIGPLLTDLGFGVKSRHPHDSGVVNVIFEKL